MESRRKRRRSQLYKWGLYVLLLLACTVLQTIPGFLHIGQAKPVFLLPLALEVSIWEDEFSGALFGAACGLMWDYTAGRTAGLLALTVMGLCFAVSVASQLYLKLNTLNFALLAAGAVWLVLSGDFLFYYAMPGYSGMLGRYVGYIPLTVLMSALLAAPLYRAVGWISAAFRIDNGVI